MHEAHRGPVAGSYWVRAGRLAAGPYPGLHGRLKPLLEAGITCFIDLTESGELHPYTAQLPEGVPHTRFSIRDLGTPSQAHMIRILDAIDAALDAGRVVYVHCWGGIGRTGTTIGCFLVRHGQTGAGALQQIAQWLHSGSPETAGQRLMVATWPEGITGPR